MRRCRAYLLTGAVLALGGCSLAPKYARPASPVPPEFPPAGMTAQAPQAADVPWQAFFTDGRLREVVERALANNRDLRIATLNIERAQALYGVQRADRFPPVQVGATVSSQRIPDKVANSGEAYTATTYTVALGVSSWELDVFGRIRNLEAAALEFIGSSQSVPGAFAPAVVPGAGTHPPTPGIWLGAIAIPRWHRRTQRHSPGNPLFVETSLPGRWTSV